MVIVLGVVIMNDKHISEPLVYNSTTVQSTYKPLLVVGST
jgi:hypothetical protein